MQNFFKQSAIDKCKPEISKFNKRLLVVMGKAHNPAQILSSLLSLIALHSKYIFNGPIGHSRQIKGQDYLTIFHACALDMSWLFSYPTSKSGIIVLLKTPTEYREFFPSLFVKTTDFQLVFNFEQTCTVTKFGEHGIMAHIP